MKDCMMMQALMNKRNLLVPDTDKKPRHYEHLECGQAAGRATFSNNGPHVLPQPAIQGVWQFI